MAETPARTRCKMTLDAVTRRMGTKEITDEGGVKKWIPAPTWDVEFSPVYGKQDPNHENSKFWRYSPSGSLKLSTINEDAVKHMEIGREYYVDITEAPSDVPAT